MRISLQRTKDDSAWTRDCETFIIDGRARGRLLVNGKESLSLFLRSRSRCLFWLAPDGSRLKNLVVFGIDLEIYYEDGDILKIGADTLFISAELISQDSPIFSLTFTRDNFGEKPLLTAMLGNLEGEILIARADKAFESQVVSGIKIVSRTILPTPLIVGRRRRLSPLTK